MARKSTSAKRLPKTARASVSFPPNVYDELEKLAVAKKVSIAWIVREAAEKYVADQWPLLGNAEQENSK